MAELRDILPQRLKEVFKNEKNQTVTAEKLKTVQSNISKWVTGESLPPPDVLFTIAKMYRVSVDWLMGLSDEKEVDAVSIKKLTYEQISLIIHRLIELGSVEILDMAQFDSASPENVDEVDNEADKPKATNYDPDYIKITDMGLSYLLRTRWKLREIDDDTMAFWMDNYVKRFKGVRLLKFDEKTKKILNEKPWATFKAGDWAELLKEISNMNQKEIKAMTKKKKDGIENGR